MKDTFPPLTKIQVPSVLWDNDNKVITLTSVLDIHKGSKHVLYALLGLFAELAIFSKLYIYQVYYVLII